MTKLSTVLLINRCPHCSIANPTLQKMHETETWNHNQTIKRCWRFYNCSSCGKVVTAWGESFQGDVEEIFPKLRQIDDTIPERPRTYLKQAVESMHAPSGAIMLSASAVDSMLKIHGYKNGSLYSRIELAVKDNIITEKMAAWAHKVRLDANDERHADEDSDLPDSDDAQNVIEFSLSLAQYLFVLPSRIEEGINISDSTDEIVT